MAEQRRRRSVSQAYLIDLLSSQLEYWQTGLGKDFCEIVDVGGGTGGLAAALAEAGHQVTVIDPSPDALASLQRRTDEAGMSDRIRGLQGDANDVVDLVGTDGADVVICHRVLEVVDSPTAALRSMSRVIRPGGCLSLLVPQRHAAVLTQALAGHLSAARRIYAGPDRFDLDQLTKLVTTVGFKIAALHGIGAIADHIPDAMLESVSGASAELYAIESEISQDPTFRAVAPQLHVFAIASADRPA